MVKNYNKTGENGWFNSISQNGLHKTLCYKHKIIKTRTVVTIEYPLI